MKNNKILLISGILSIIIIITLIVLLVYFNKYRTNKMICTYSATADVYAIKTKYIVTFKNKIVKNIYTEETLTKYGDKVLNDYKTTLDSLYQPYSKLKYYDYSVELKDNQVTSKININYEKLDINKFISIDSNNKKILTNNKVMIKTIKKIYKNNGARCTYR